MAAPLLESVPKPNPKQLARQGTAASGEAIVVNLPENAGSSEQRQILDALPVLVFLERGGRIVFANSEARQMLGFPDGEWTPRPVEEVLWGLLPGAAEPQTLLAATRRGSPFHATMPAGNGRLLSVQGTYSPTDAGLRDAVIVAHPGGREKAPKTRLMEEVLSSLPEAVAIEHGNHILYTNPAFTAMFGYSGDEAGGGSLRELIVPESCASEHAALLRAVDEKGRACADTVRVDKDGESIRVSLQIAPLLVDGARLGYVFSFRSIGEQKQNEARLQHDAMHDALTGLPNRALFMDRLTEVFKRRSRHPERRCGVIYLGLDRFQEINGGLGHAAGDLLLKSVAERLVGALRPQDSAARLGGDEFAVLVENIPSVSDLEAVAARVLAEMERPFEVFGHRLQSGASLGIALARPRLSSPATLLRDADLAMCHAKQAGGGRVEIFTPETDPAPGIAAR